MASKQPTRLNVALHDGSTFTLEIDNFDSAQLRKQMEETKRDHVLVGDFPIYKSSIRYIVPAPPQEQ